MVEQCQRRDDGRGCGLGDRQPGRPPVTSIHRDADPLGLGFRLRDVAAPQDVADPNAGMGIAVADYDGDGRSDLFVSNARGQDHAIYRGGADGFADARGDFAAALGDSFTGWGASWVDLDLDTDLDLVLVNGDIPVASLAEDAEPIQVLENVPGVSKVSEGQAAVPAIRGLARGRTLILIDGARVTSERRAGPSATYLDPFGLEGIQVSRGPGSVAYGSDAFGGVIHARTRRPVPGSPLGMRFIGAIGAGEPQERVGVEVSKGLSQGGVLFQGHYRDFDDYQGRTTRNIPVGIITSLELDEGAAAALARQGATIVSKSRWNAQPLQDLLRRGARTVGMAEA